MRNLILFSLFLSLFSCKKNDTTPGSGSFNAFYNFPPSSPGSFVGGAPQGDLIISGSTLYGLTTAGGTNGVGNIFSISTNGSNYVDMHDFDTSDGWDPMGDLLLVNGTLYGLTHQGGLYQEGVLFSINASGGGFKVLYNFGSGTSGVSGVYPNGSLIMVSGLLYGMTSEGGKPGNGNIFSFNPTDSTYADVYDFKNNQAVFPGGTLTYSNGVLYGMAYLGGGSNNDGVVFSISLNGTGYQNLVVFTGTNGANPDASLLLVGSTLYGTCNAGGANGNGNIFSVSITGTGFQDLYDFNANTGPASPSCTLISSGNTLYGTATGGADIGGYVFSIPTSGGTITDLYPFNTGANGSFPIGGVLLNSGVLYGMTSAGGKYSFGTIYSLPL